MLRTLAQALWDSSHPSYLDVRQIARDILPAVCRIAREFAADELESEAAYDDAAPDEQYARYLFANRLRERADNLRADALDPPDPA